MARFNWLRSTVLVVAALSPSCGARTGLNAGPPAPPEPDCYRDSDCEDAGDLCVPVVCVLDIPPVRPGADRGGHCVALDPIDCDDNDPCTNDTCQPATGLCTYDIATFDLDGDGYRGPRVGTIAGEKDSCGDDCDDTNAAAHPGGVEVCDGVDNDCNGIIDDNATFVPMDATPIQISTPDLENAQPAGLGWSGDTYVAEYTANQGQRIFTAQLTTSGEKLPPGDRKLTDVETDSFGGPLLWIGDRYGAVWQDRRDGNYEIFFSYLKDTGEKARSDVQLTNAGGFSIYPSLGWNGTQFIVVWQDERDNPGLYNVYGQILDVDGNPVGGNVPLTSDQIGFGNEAPWVAVGDKSVAVVWGIGDTDYRYIQFQTFTPDLKPMMEKPISLTDGNTNVRGQFVAWNEGNYVVAWNDESGSPKGVYAAVVEEDGTVSVPKTLIADPGSGKSRNPNLKGFGNRVLAVYQDNRDGGKYEIYARMVRNDLVPLTPEERITFTPDDSAYPIASFGPDGNVGILFRDYSASPVNQHVFFTRLGCVASTGP